MTAAPTRADVERLRVRTADLHKTVLSCDYGQPYCETVVRATDYDALLSREAQLREAIAQILVHANTSDGRVSGMDDALNKIGDIAEAAINTRSAT